MNSEDLKKRTKVFAHRCIRLALSLPNTKLGKHIQRQLIRYATSVVANYRATCLAQTPKAFIAKISIPIEEAGEITAILVASRKTSQKNLKKIEDSRKKNKDDSKEK